LGALPKRGIGVSPIYTELKAQGTPISTNDIGLAALTLQNGLRLYSRDAHFKHLPQLQRL
jgi:predicted nucleic acid-binding protein